VLLEQDVGDEGLVAAVAAVHLGAVVGVHIVSVEICRERNDFVETIGDVCDLNRVTRGRCYDHNFRQFLPIFGEKIGGFLKNQCYDQFCFKIWLCFE
jgi:hypothetical protein